MSDGPPGSLSYVNNYEEMEWRIVLDTSGTFTADSLVPDAYRMKFDPADVALIVFPDQDVMRLTLNDSDMKSFFAVHQPDLLLLEDCKHF